MSLNLHPPKNGQDTDGLRGKKTPSKESTDGSYRKSMAARISVSVGRGLHVEEEKWRGILHS